MKLVDHGGVEVLDSDECLRLLRAGKVGRLGIVTAGQPVILPVNYAVDGENVVFRTDPGLKLDAGPRSPACFEIDSFDLESRSGWSVLAVGRLEELTEYDGDALSRVPQLDLAPWAPGERTHWMQFVPHRVTGRRVGTATT